MMFLGSRLVERDISDLRSQLTNWLPDDGQTGSNGPRSDPISRKPPVMSAFVRHSSPAWTVDAFAWQRGKSGLPVFRVEGKYVVAVRGLEPQAAKT